VVETKKKNAIQVEGTVSHCNYRVEQVFQLYMLTASEDDLLSKFILINIDQIIALV